MTIRRVFSVFILFFSVSAAYADESVLIKENTTALAASQCNNLIDAEVNGLVCDFCARALEKVFGRQKDVLNIDVNLDQGHISIAMKEGKTLDDKTLKKLIKHSGYNLIAIKKGC